MSGSSQNRESPHFYIVILHAGAVLKDFMPYPAPDGVAADFLRAGDAVAEGDVQRIPFQGAELIADAPPVVAAQGDAAVLDDRAAVGTVIAPGQHGVRALFHIVLCHAVRLFHGDVAVVHDGAGLIAYHTENGLAILRTDGAILHPDVCGAALPQRDEPHRAMIGIQPLLRLCLIEAAAREDDIPHRAAPSPDRQQLVGTGLVKFTVLEADIPALHPVRPVAHPDAAGRAGGHLAEYTALKTDILVAAIQVGGAAPPLVGLTVEGAAHKFHIAGEHHPEHIVGLTAVRCPEGRRGRGHHQSLS